MQDCIAFHEKLEVTNICKESKFLTIIDESTDISVTLILAVVVRYFDSNKHDVIDALLDIQLKLKMEQLNIFTKQSNVF